MKVLKKILIGVAVLLVILIAAAAILPMVFKDDIKAAVDREIAKSVNADVVFESRSPCSPSGTLVKF